MKFHNQLLSEVESVIQEKVPFNLVRTNDLMNAEIAQEFGTRLRLFHYLTDQPLTKKAFEFQLCKTLINNDIQCAMPENNTLPGADLILGAAEQKLSLKTEGAKSTSRKKITISKLMEARWFRDCKNDTELMSAIQQRMVPHLQSYDRMLTLRSFPSKSDACIYYQLVEIPLELIRSCSKKDRLRFSSRSRGGSVTVTVATLSEQTFQLVFDASVEKVTVKNLEVGDCHELANWTISI